MACSLLADALAVAAQSLMARDLGEGNVAGARHVAARVGSLSLGLGLLLACGMAAGGRVLPAVFSSDPEVLRLVSGRCGWVVVVRGWGCVVGGDGGGRPGWWSDGPSISRRPERAASRIEGWGAAGL
jgi:Na+-driven multidrug efflux pump